MYVAHIRLFEIRRNALIEPRIHHFIISDDVYKKIHLGRADIVQKKGAKEAADKAPAGLNLQQLQQGPLAGYMPYTRQTQGVLRSLADLKPEALAVRRD